MDGSKEFTLKSGAVLAVTTAPFADAKGFQNEVFKAAQGQSLTGLEMFDLAALVASSAPVEAAFFKCAGRALYKPDGTDGTAQKVTPALFDDPTYGEKARGDYHEIFGAVAEVNVRPFMPALFSVLKAFLPETGIGSLKSK